MPIFAHFLNNLISFLLALSGIYTISYGFDGYMDEVVYNNSPLDFLPNMANDHPYIEQYNARKSVV